MPPAGRAKEQLREGRELAVINGQWGLLRFIDGRLESAQSLEIAGGRIARVHVQRNPDKLAQVAAAWGEAGARGDAAPARAGRLAAGQ